MTNQKVSGIAPRATAGFAPFDVRRREHQGLWRIGFGEGQSV